MDKIIYIYVSLIKWSKTREHAEHIADSAILSIKHAYRIKISFATGPYDMAKWQKACSGTVTLTDVTSAI